MIVTDAKGEEHAYTLPAAHPPATSSTASGSRRARSSTRARSTRPTCSRSAAAPTTELYLVGEVQKVYKAQGVDINDKHIELIVRQMLKKVRIESKGSTDAAARASSRTATSSSGSTRRSRTTAARRRKGEEVILGITKASLATESFLSAASFQETTKVLTDAALEGKRDRLVGLKENVIIGKLIPAATGLKHYRSLEIEPVEPAQRPEEDLLDEEELAAELGLAEDGEEVTELEGFGPSFAEELEELAQEIETGADAETT